ncbi:MAG: PEP-CTERM sorting domain-containing protein [Verrucomicrobiota bacterium]
MKTNKTCAVVTGAMLWTTGLAFGQSETNFTFNVNEAIPQADPIGLALGQDLTVTGGDISSVTVSLDITGGFNGDLYAYLVGPNGGFAVLLNRVGMSSENSFGYSDSGLDVTFSDTAAVSIHDYQTVPDYSLSGTTWQPDGENIDPQSSPSAFTGTQTAMLSSFDDTDPNGTWMLYLADLSSGSTSTLDSWTINVTTTAVPEPQTWTLTILGLAGTLLAIRRRSRI